MSTWFLQYEIWFRAGAFVTVLAVLLLAQRHKPRRAPASRVARLYSNGGLLLVSTLIARLMLPLLPVAVAAWAHVRNYGLLPLVDLPLWAECLVSMIVLDIAIYWQHRLMHAIPLLWRLHRVHHSDVHFDVSTALRFHPIEIVLSMWFKAAIVIALGAPAVAVVVFEIILNAAAMFNHSNIHFAEHADRRLRRLLVTPDMHRIHHSVDPRETDTNFGFSVSLWDRLFGSYQEQPRLAQTTMPVGLDYFRHSEEQGLLQLLLQPFRKPSQTPDKKKAAQSAAP